MRERVNFIVLITILLVSAVIVSCNQKDTVEDEFVPKTSTTDYLNVLKSLNLSTIEEITSGDENNEKSAEVLGCLTVTVHPNEAGKFWPRSWTMDYGTENCQCFLGVNRRGKINVVLSDWWRYEGSLREITFEDFYFNDCLLEGTKTYLNTGLNERENITFTKKEIDAKLTYADSTFISWNSEKYSELIEGSKTVKFADDVWSVTGGGAGVNLDGKDYTFTITSPLIYKNGCYHPVSGVIEVEVPNEDLKVIDYGLGECDNKATVTIGDASEEIEL